MPRVFHSVLDFVVIEVEDKIGYCRAAAMDPTVPT